jgi:hypothetical protein
MTDFQTNAPVFIAILAAYTICQLYFFGAHKAFFEPFKEPPEGSE